jgi:peptidyl-prolyl cis-trans isomerase C
MGAFDSARAAYERAIRHDPRHVAAHNNLGSLLERGGRVTAALGHFERSTDLDSTFVTAWINVGRTRFMMGRLVEAAQAYLKALSLKPDLVDAHTNLAGVYVETGDLDRAIHHLERATLLAPASGAIKEGLAEVVAMRNDRDRRRAGGEMRARHIVVKSEALASSLLQRIRSGENFAALARTHSADPSAASGGDIGAFKPGDLLPEFEERVKELPPGGVGGPFQTAMGWHIIERTY